MSEEERLQRQYYALTAAAYDDMHPSYAKHVALTHILTFVELYFISSILDVGCGTGRGLKFFMERRPDIRICGSDPAQELLTQATAKGIPGDYLICCSGYSLPFEDGAFDATCALGILYHVREPIRVIAEMRRVSRRAVFIADANRFGQGSLGSRLLKLTLWALGLWPIVNYVRTGDEGYTISEGDGLAYSYSVFDSYSTLTRLAKEVLLIPTQGASKSFGMSGLECPILTSSHLLVCAGKQ